MYPWPVDTLTAIEHPTIVDHLAISDDDSLLPAESADVEWLSPPR